MTVFFKFYKFEVLLIVDCRINVFEVSTRGDILSSDERGGRWRVSKSGPAEGPDIQPVSAGFDKQQRNYSWTALR